MCSKCENQPRAQAEQDQTEHACGEGQTAKMVHHSTLPPSSAQTMLRQSARAYRLDADRLDALVKALPLELPPLANEAMCSLLYGAKEPA